MRLFTILILIFLLFIMFIIFESIREMKQLRTTEYSIHHSKLPKEFYEFKLILLSDLHNCFANIDKIIDTIKNEKPNGVIIAGDIVVYDNNKKNKNNNIHSLEFVKQISNYSDVYYAPGNHEMGYMIKNNKEWIEYERILIDPEYDNIYFLDNKHIELTRGNSKINIYGLHLTDGYYKRFYKKALDENTLNSLLGTSADNEYNILIAHNPDYFSDYSNWGADLVLSGHNHGGLMIVPGLGGVISPRLRIFPKYDYGLFVDHSSKLILTGGLGAHSLKIRVNNKPELVIINFNQNKQ